MSINNISVIASVRLLGRGRSNLVRIAKTNQNWSWHDSLEKGFSLIETIIALGLVLATIFIFSSALSALPLTKSVRNQNVAYHIAAKRVEELRNTPFASLPASGGNFTDLGLANLASSTANFTIGNYESSTQIKQVTVTVTWWEQAVAKNVILETLISNSGLNQP